MWVAISSVAVAAVYVAAIAGAIHAAQTARTPQGAVGWVVFLLTVPFLAIPFYLILGHHRLKGYLISRRETSRVVEAIKNFGHRHAPEPDSVGVALGPFEYCAGLPAVKGNSGELLIDGDATFDAIFAAIDAAENYVLAQFYIIHDDALGKAFQDRLIAAAQRGVTVRMMTDAVGSITLPESYFAKLRDAGVQVVDPRNSRGPRFRFQINYRNHRKTVIVDGRIGFTGGLNVGDEYMGLSPVFGLWRDTHIKLQGPMVTQLQLIFVEDWHWSTEEALLDDLHWLPDETETDAVGLIVATGPGDVSETGSLLFFSAITEATDRIWIASPYFVPDLDILTALRHAALRGVDVRILVPDVIDHRIPWLAAFAYFDEIMEAGVRVFRYTDGFMHQKVFVVDDSLAAVGTTNLDNRSFRLNFECMALFFDQRMAADVDKMLRADFEKCFELTIQMASQSRYIRHGAPVARLFAPLL
ncbi:cardiolipin synthase [Falsiphaeobacter marinintestinus]|uniref:cardiolipin synthase n=1 Tax=Falsiphaeobacter marinintestinus TaxID=1492905 RepID=UPI0011B42E72|nr:cardiolipin synthase [Phaeobacter marinintestinus]